MTLAEEAQRYLAAVDAFRAEGCEPEWRSEVPPAGSSFAARLEPVERRKQCSD
jgi:hypothetical protein